MHREPKRSACRRRLCRGPRRFACFAALAIVFSLTAPGCNRDRDEAPALAPPPGGTSPAPDDLAARNPAGSERVEARSEETYEDLPEITRGRTRLLNPARASADQRAVWRPETDANIALWVETTEERGAVTARILASLGGRLAADVYRCTGLDPEGAEVVLQLDREGAPHILCIDHAARDGEGSTLGIRLRWDRDRRAIVPDGTWKVDATGVSPDEALAAAEDSSEAAGSDE